MFSSRLALIVTIGGLVSGSTPLLASGTYPPAPPRLASDVANNVDPVVYNLGKSIFTGRASLSAQASLSAADTARLRTRLADLQLRLPERARDKVDLPALAGQLTSADADALRYYVELRFRLTEANS